MSAPAIASPRQSYSQVTINSIVNNIIYHIIGKPANVEQGAATNHRVAAMCTCAMFNIRNNSKPVCNICNNQYTGSESGNMNNDE